MNLPAPWRDTGRSGVWTTANDGAEPLVLVHGIRVSAHMWEPHVRRLVPEFQVTVCDLPGHGALADRTFTLEAAVEQVRAAVAAAAEAAGRPVVLAGMSLGGYVALAHTARYPEHVAGLLLNNCTAAPRGAAARHYQRAGRLLRWAGAERTAALNAWVFRRTLPPESAAAVLGGGLWMSAAADVVDDLPRHDFLAMPGRLRTPLLIVNSRADRLFRADELAYLRAARAAGNEARLFHTKGNHILALTDPDLYTRLLRHAHPLLAE